MSQFISPKPPTFLICQPYGVSSCDSPSLGLGAGDLQGDAINFLKLALLPYHATPLLSLSIRGQ